MCFYYMYFIFSTQACNSKLMLCQIVNIFLYLKTLLRTHHSVFGKFYIVFTSQPLKFDDRTQFKQPFLIASKYKNHWISFQNFFVWALLLIVHYETLVPFEVISSGCNALVVPFQQLLEGPMEVLLCECGNDFHHNLFHLLNCHITTAFELRE